MPKKDGRGRPSKFTQAVRDKILEAIRWGNYRPVAAAYAGIGHRTLNTWLAQGAKEESGAYFTFRQDLLAAENEAEINAVKAVLQDPDVKHKQWFLERKFPERWGKDRDLLRELCKRIRDLEAKSGVSAGSETTSSDATA